MSDEYVTLSELALLLLLVGGPVYCLATGMLAWSMRRRPTLRRRALVLRAWLLAVPLTLVVWWGMGLLGHEVLHVLIPGSEWSGPIIVAIPATVASLVGFGLVWLLAVRGRGRSAA